MLQGHGQESEKTTQRRGQKFAYRISDKECESRMYKELLQLKRKRQPN